MKRPTPLPKPPQSLELVLELGQKIKLTIQQPNGLKPVKTRSLILDNWVANFQEALDVPHESYLLKDFCGENFFQRKTGLSYQTLYRKTLNGDPEGAELFVEFGAHVGALIANLERLFQPTKIAVKGPMTKTFDAWSHAMGKARNKFLGKKPKIKITLN